MIFTAFPLTDCETQYDSVHEITKFLCVTLRGKIKCPGAQVEKQVEKRHFYQDFLKVWCDEE